MDGRACTGRKELDRIVQFTFFFFFNAEGEEQREGSEMGLILSR